MKIKVKKLHPNAVIPQYKSEGAAAFDLCCIEDFNLPPGETVVVRTGLAFELPEGYCMHVVVRSGVAKNLESTLMNGYGLIDNDYRGEICLLLRNHYKSMWKFKAGERIAQGQIVEMHQFEIEEVEELSDTERGEGGFGSTGK